MCIYNRFTEGKSQAQPAPAVPLLVLRCIKHLKQFIFLFIRHTFSIVCDFRPHKSILLKHVDLDLGPGRRIFNGIINHVNKHLHDQSGIHLCHQKFIILLHSDPVFSAFSVQMVHGLVDHIIQKFRLSFQIHGTVLNSGDRKQIFYQIDQPDGIIINIPINFMPLRFLHLGTAVEKHTGISGNTCQRRAQVMGYGTKQICPQTFLPGIHLHLFFLLIQPLLFKCQSTFIQHGKEQASLKGSEFLGSHNDPCHCQRFFSAPDSQIQAFCPGQRICCGTGMFIVLVYPGYHFQFFLIDILLCIPHLPVIRPRHQTARFIRHIENDHTAQHFLHLHHSL